MSAGTSLISMFVMLALCKHAVRRQDPCPGACKCHHSEKERGSPIAVAFDEARAGNHASSRPVPSGVAAERVWTPRRLLPLTVEPMG